MSYSNTLLLGSKIPRSLTIEEATVHREEKSTLESILEFDESIYLEDMVLTSRFYTGLLESSDAVINENVIDAISDFLANVIIKITSFFERIFGGFGGGGKDKDEDGVAKTSVNYGKHINANLTWIEKNKRGFNYNSYPEENGELTFYEYANGLKPPTIENLTGNRVEAISKAAELSDKIATYINAGQIDETEFNNMVKECTEYIQIAVDELDAVDVKDLIKSEKKEVVLRDHVKQFLSTTSSYSTYRKAASEIKTSSYPQFDRILKSMQNFQDKIKAKPEVMEPLSVAIRELTTKQAGLCTRLNQKFATYNGLMYQSIYVETNQVVTIMKKYMYPSSGDGSEPTTESYVTDDAQWLIDQIALETHNYHISCYSRLSSNMLQETRIKMNPDADIVYEMQILNEKVTKDIKKGFEKFTAKIKELFGKFMEKLRANITTTRHYLDKYKKVILGNKVPSDYTTKNILAGMDRVLNYEIPAFQYNSIKNSLETPYNFFSMLISDQHANIAGNFQPSPDAQVNETDFSVSQVGKYFKEYFGMTPDDKTLTASQVQGRIKDIYDYLYDAGRIEKSIKKSIDSIDKMRVQAMKQAGVSETNAPTDDGVTRGVKEPNETTAQEPPKAGEPAGQPTVNPNPTGESYLSYYGQVFHELERANTGTQGTTNNANMTGKTAQNMKNVGTVNTKDAKGQVQYGTNGTPVEEVERHLSNYADVAVKVLEAKLTAAEFIRSELMGIVRDIVQAYVAGETEQHPTQVNGQNKTPNTLRNASPAGSENGLNRQQERDFQRLKNKVAGNISLSRKEQQRYNNYINAGAQ